MFARWAARAAAVLSTNLFSHDEIRSAWHRLQGASTPLTPRARMAWLLMRLAGLFLHLPRLAEQVRVVFVAQLVQRAVVVLYLPIYRRGVTA